MRNKENNKKQYTSPVLEVVQVDHEISLVMASSDVPDHPSSVSKSVSITSSSEESAGITTQSEVFGSSEPNYN